MIALHRLRAFFLRHLYPLQRDFDILSDMIYWPLIDTILWGVTSKWLFESSDVPNLMSAILIALILWNVIWRAQAEVARNLIDEIWNNNLVNLFSTPLTLKEWIVGVIGLSILKTGITLVLLIVAIKILYAITPFVLGWWLLLFILSGIMTGWWVGFVSAGIVLRYGPKIQTVVWTLPGMLIPFSAIYFPVAKLPWLAQMVSWLVPTTYTFETMRGLVMTGTGNWTYMAISYALNFGYLALAIWYFRRSFEYSRKLGLGRFD